jgi:hypothetical protein
LRQAAPAEQDPAMISAATFLSCELVGSALLALWVVARFPQLGPRSLRPALGCTLASLLLLRVVGASVTAVVALPHGTYLALFGCALPTFFAGFLAAAWLLRVLGGMMGGSGGGPGEPVTSRG